MKNQGADKREVDDVIEGRPWWKSCLIIVGITLVVLVLVSVVMIRFFSGSGPRRVKEIPENFPSSFTLFRPEAIRDVYLYTAAEKQRPLKFASLPLRLMGRVSGEATTIADKMERGTSAIQNADTVSIEWVDVDTSVQDILLFYAGSMMQAGIYDPQVRATDQGDVSEMIGTSALINVHLYVLDDPKTEKVDQITLSVDYPPEAKK